MRKIRTGNALLASAFFISSMASGQTTPRRGNTNPQQTGANVALPPQQPAQPGAAGRNNAGRGAAALSGADAGSISSEFFNFDTSATQVRLSANVDGPPVETHQKITVNGQPFAYTARVGFMPLLNATTGLPLAHLFFTSYAKDGISDTSGRPLMFFFGGAPGVSAAWQELGGFGPKRMKSEGTWTDNPDTILNQADLVFVNPVGTGFSFPAQPNHGPNFWNTSGDIASLAEFVRLYVNRNHRLASPLFVAGEDAATGRVAGLANYLSDHMIPVRGVVLFSMTPAADAVAGDTQYITLLPSLILSSWYHKKLSPQMNALSSEQIAGQARQFASREYLHALYKGDRMNPEERTKVIADLSRLTGLSKAFIANNNLRITLDRYNGELMRDQHLSLSRSDARVTGFTPPTTGQFGGGGGGRGFGAAQTPVDFNMSAITGPFAAAYDSYLRRELTFNGDKEGIFYLTRGGVGSFTSTGNDDMNLSAVLSRNPSLHLFVSINYFDLGSPFYTTEYALAHLNVSPEVRSHNITISHQEAGQMGYMDSKASAKLERDLASFITQAITTK